MLSLQQPSASKQRLGHMEPADIQLHLLAASNSRTAFSYQNQYNTQSSPKQKKRSVIRRLPTSKQDPNSKAAIEKTPGSSFTTEMSGANKTLPKSQPKASNSQPNDQRKKNSTSNVPPRFREKRQQQSNKNKKGSSLATLTVQAQKESGQNSSKKNPPTTTSTVLDTALETTQLSKENLISVEMCEESTLLSCDCEQTSSGLQNVLVSSSQGLDSRLSIDLLSPNVCSDEEDMFQDALSDFPTSGMSSTRSSAFVTPSSTRSQSPINYNCLDNTHSLDLVQEKLEDLNRSSPEDTPSCGSHVTLVDGLENEDTTNCPYSFLNNSHIHETDNDPILPRRYSSDTVKMLVGDIEVEVNGQKCDSFELPLSPVEYNDEEHDSGCSMSIGSPSKSSLKLKAKRPGLIYMPREIMDMARRVPHASFELGSVSTASPPSSVCSHSSNSPTSLSPSPTPPSVSQQPQDNFQEWPDFDHKPTPRVNGLVPHSNIIHHPTHEEMLKMEKWRNNLMNQLREQQEKLDLKKKQKEEETFLHHPQLHGFLPPETFPLHRSLPPTLPSHVPMPHPVIHHHGYSHPGYWAPPPPLMFMCPPHPPPHMRPAPHHTLTQHTTIIPSTTTHSVQSEPIKQHPLCEKWVLWYDKIMGSHKNSSSVSDYKASLKKIYTVSTIEDFWRLYNNIKAPSGLENSCNYHFFKEGINPMWEDTANLKGGKWVLTIKDNTVALDKAWLEVLLMFIGGCVSRMDIVNGVVVSRRKKGNKISVWTSQTDKTANLEICKELIKSLVLACDVKTKQLPLFLKHLSEFKAGMGLVFMHHTDSLRTGSSYQIESHIQLKDYIQDLLRELGCW